MDCWADGDEHRQQQSRIIYQDRTARGVETNWTEDENDEMRMKMVICRNEPRFACCGVSLLFISYGRPNITSLSSSSHMITTTTYPTNHYPLDKWLSYLVSARFSHLCDLASCHAKKKFVHRADKTLISRYRS